MNNKYITINVCTINNLQLKDVQTEFLNTKYGFGIMPSKKSILFNAFSSKKSGDYIGLSAFERHAKLPSIHQSKKIDASEIGKAWDKLLENSSQLLGMGQYLMMSLWLIKDNSCNLGSIYGTILNDDATPLIKDINPLIHNGTEYFNNSRCDFIETLFSKEELNEALILYEKMLPYIIVPKENVNFELLNEQYDNQFPGPFNLIDYNNFNRISRALFLLSAARSNFMLPSKISNYMSVLEVLFSTNPGEISHKISERCSIYLETNIEKRLGIYSKIKKAYNVRSKFVHGQMLSKDSKSFYKLAEISNNIDSILRQVFLKILKTDFKIFLKQNEELEIYFKRMVLS